MRARITHISLTLPGRLVEIGEVVERGADVPEDVFDARLAAGTAELVSDGLEPSRAATEAIATYMAAFAPLQAALLAALDAVEGGSLADARALVDALMTQAPLEYVQASEARIREIFRRVDEADVAELNSLSSAGPAAGETEAGGDAASEAADATGRAPAAEHSQGTADVPASESEASPQGPREGAIGPSSGDAAAGNAAASNDATQPEPGLDGDAGGAQTPPAEPADPEPSTPKKKPARKGAAREG